jgi:hypothetical protein
MTQKKTTPDTEADVETPIDGEAFLQAVSEFAYSVPHERYIYRLGTKWQDGTPVTDKGIRQFLVARGYPVDLAEAILKKGLFTRTLKNDIVPNEPAITKDEEGHAILNLWSPPRLSPAEKQTPAPRVEAILEWLTGCPHENPTPEQEGGLVWLIHWLARKVQNPALLSLVAPIFGTEPGAGKNTLFGIVAAMLGEDNCVIIDRGQLESKYTPWGSALFVLGDEIKSSENAKDVEEKLKILIASPKVMVEVKNVNAVTIPNRKAWMFASNDRISPIKIDPNDRRYTYFRNHTPVTPEYDALVRSCYLPDGSGFEPAFVEEIRGFWRMLLDLTVEVAYVSRPYRNEAREGLISTGFSAHELFVKAATEDGIDALLDAMLDTPRGLKFRGEQARKEWDFGKEGIAKTAIYEAYRAFCETEGKHPLSATRFGPAVRHIPGVFESRCFSPTLKRVRVWVFPRTPARSEVEHDVA